MSNTSHVNCIGATKGLSAYVQVRAESKSKAQERFDAFRSIATVIRVRFDRVVDRPLLERGGFSEGC